MTTSAFVRGARDASITIAATTLALFLFHLDRSTAQLNGVLANANLAMARLATASAALENAAQGQQSYVDRTSRELAKTVADAHDLLAHTDISLNGTKARPGLIPQLGLAIEAQSASALETQDTLRVSIADVSALSRELQASAANVAALSADPRVGQSLAELAASSKNLNATTAEAAGTMQDVHKAIDWEIAQLEKPVKPLKAAAEETVSLLGRFFGFH